MSTVQLAKIAEADMLRPASPYNCPLCGGPCVDCDQPLPKEERGDRCFRDTSDCPPFISCVIHGDGSQFFKRTLRDLEAARSRTFRAIAGALRAAARSGDIGNSGPADRMAGPDGIVYARDVNGVFRQTILGVWNPGEVIPMDGNDPRWHQLDIALDEAAPARNGLLEDIARQGEREQEQELPF